MMITSALYGLAFLVLTRVGAAESSEPDYEAQTVYAVNCGGYAHRGAYNIYYHTDSNAVGTASDYGTRYAFLNANPLDVPLYQTERYHSEDFSYKATLKDGQYVVVLKFSEVYFQMPKLKVFDVMFNGITVVNNLDIFREARGTGFAYDVYIDVAVKNKEIQVLDQLADFDSTLEIVFARGAADNPKVNAIAIIKGAASSLPPPPQPAPELPTQMHPQFEEEEEWTQSLPPSTVEDDEDMVDHSFASGPPMKNPFEEGDNVFWIAIATSFVVIIPIFYFLCGRSEKS